ncbi:MAG: VIT1/CCC1 transporter family protein, partial [Bdellovibrionales bacterium]|nr:VIT1/CCC1 transporter family protein [Bdellovibrionales bacterium]
EIRQIYIRKGFSGELLEQIVDTISKNKKLWVNTMLTEEWGLQLSSIAPMRSALLTFAAFIAAGVAPLLPLLLGLFTDIRSSEIFLYSALLTSIVFLATGTLRGIILNLPVMRSALETFFVGGMAALLAYFVGDILGGFLL